MLLAAGLAVSTFFVQAPVSYAAESTIGVVNRQAVFNAYPGMEETMKQLSSLREAAQQDYNAQTKDLAADDQSRKTINEKVAADEAKKEDSLMQPIVKKIADAIKTVAQSKHLDTVIDAGTVLYGGSDITKDVIDKLKE